VGGGDAEAIRARPCWTGLTDAGLRGWPGRAGRRPAGKRVTWPTFPPRTSFVLDVEAGPAVSFFGQGFRGCWEGWLPRHSAARRTAAHPAQGGRHRTTRLGAGLRRPVRAGRRTWSRPFRCWPKLVAQGGDGPCLRRLGRHGGPFVGDRRDLIGLGTRRPGAPCCAPAGTHRAEPPRTPAAWEHLPRPPPTPPWRTRVAQGQDPAWLPRFVGLRGPSKNGTLVERCTFLGAAPQGSGEPGCCNTRGAGLGYVACGFVRGRELFFFCWLPRGLVSRGGGGAAGPGEGEFSRGHPWRTVCRCARAGGAVSVLGRARVVLVAGSSGAGYAGSPGDRSCAPTLVREAEQPRRFFCLFFAGRGQWWRQPHEPAGGTIRWKGAPGAGRSGSGLGGCRGGRNGTNFTAAAFFFFRPPVPTGRSGVRPGTGPKQPALFPDSAGSARGPADGRPDARRNTGPTRTSLALVPTISGRFWPPEAGSGPRSRGVPGTAGPGGFATGVRCCAGHGLSGNGSQAEPVRRPAEMTAISAGLQPGCSLMLGLGGPRFFLGRGSRSLATNPGLAAFRALDTMTPAARPARSPAGRPGGRRGCPRSGARTRRGLAGTARRPFDEHLADAVGGAAVRGGHAKGGRAEGPSARDSERRPGRFVRRRRGARAGAPDSPGAGRSGVSAAEAGAMEQARPPGEERGSGCTMAGCCARDRAGPGGDRRDLLASPRSGSRLRLRREPVGAGGERWAEAGVEVVSSGYGAGAEPGWTVSVRGRANDRWAGRPQRLASGGMAKPFFFFCWTTPGLPPGERRRDPVRR